MDLLGVAVSALHGEANGVGFGCAAVVTAYHHLVVIARSSNVGDVLFSSNVSIASVFTLR